MQVHGRRSRELKKTWEERIEQMRLRAVLSVVRSSRRAMEREKEMWGMKRGCIMGAGLEVNGMLEMLFVRHTS
jgi:hypothetical protein